MPTTRSISTSVPRTLLLALVLATGACDGGVVMPDAALTSDTGGIDGGRATDAGATDARALDAAIRLDAPSSIEDAPDRDAAIEEADAPSLGDAGSVDDAAMATDAFEPTDDAHVPDDAFTPTADAFTPPPDAFVPPADAFTPPPDAFVPPPDAFVPPPDAFTPPPDAFVAPPDAFVPPPDAFTPPPDAFTPPPDAFTPPPDAFVPPDAYMPPPPLGSMPLQNATASFSQASYPVGEVLDTLIPGLTNSNGWAISTGAGVTMDESAVFETITNSPTSAQGSIVTLTIHQTSQLEHTLGAFRVSVTTASRSSFADGLANGGNLGSPAIWSAMVPVRATATGGATLNIRADRTILASGSSPNASVYTIVFATGLSGITGLRIDALSDPTLPGNGPGRASSGNFVITELVADVAVIGAPSTVSLTNATATASQPSYSVAEAINGVTTGGNEGWAIDVGTIVAQTACFETVTSTPTGNGSYVRATLQFSTIDDYYLGRFRIAGTTADRSTFADGMANGGAIGAPAIWSTLALLSASASEPGLTFTPLSDGSFLVAGAGTRPTFTMQLATPLSGLTGIRLEAMEDPSLPSSGPGVATNGNFILTEMSVAASAL